jgi:hypothetical protein
MKSIIQVILSVAVVTFMSGCAGSSSAVVNADSSARQGVFQEVSVGEVRPGKALLKIEFPVKAFKARLINTYIKHSNPPYTVVLTIDGQSAVLTDEPVLEDLPGDFKNNPEAGTGWRYQFRKELLLDPGKFHVTITVPLSDVAVEKDVTLNAGTNSLQLIPVYNASVSRYPNHPRFNHGLSRVAVKLNNQEL